MKAGGYCCIEAMAGTHRSGVYATVGWGDGRVGDKPGTLGQMKKGFEITC